MPRNARRSSVWKLATKGSTTLQNSSILVSWKALGYA